MVEMGPIPDPTQAGSTCVEQWRQGCEGRAREAMQVRFDRRGWHRRAAPVALSRHGCEGRARGTLQVRLDRLGHHRHAVSVALSRHGCVGRAIPKMLYYYQGFDGSVFDWLEYWHDNTGNQMVEYSTKVDCLSCEQDKCKLAGRPYGQFAPGGSHSE